MSSKSTNEDTKGLNPSSQSHYPVPTDNSNVERAVPRSMIGKAVTIRGDIAAREDVLINGRLEGSIALKSNKLEIGVDGHIEANMFAKVIVVSGKAFGDVYASDQVVVTKTGSVIGDIYTADVSIEDGAHIKGNIDMQKQDVFKQHAVPEIQDESHNKSSGFGFLFKKGREHEHEQAEHDAGQGDHAHVNVSEELIPLSVNNKSDSENLYPDQSIIGESVMIKGELIAEEDVVVKGQIDGVIYFKNNSLGLGPHSQIHANIFVKSIVAHGEVKGDIYASDQIILKKPGHVNGKLHSPRVSTEKGAVIMGSIIMEAQNIEEIYANFTGSRATDQHQSGTVENRERMEAAAHPARTAEERADSGSRAAASTKESGWPIFYPRS
ncbi:hypothetical protein AQUSIP_10500 [Aquicella siphonis]|uniref:Polymer-forming cytoskeletal n=1 Tax=Aquicella siphonis TaxID=254247 RepID=A0A5E4PHF8_9COXI|nr:polymer-forming cytoskeletal protein [Aquicella siphonis]VVC75756.1 hypothetical protein AQUSIP_10500 [Aquicella siphonis]